MVSIDKLVYCKGARVTVFRTLRSLKKTFISYYKNKKKQYFLNILIIYIR